MRSAAIAPFGALFTGLGLWAGIDASSFTTVLADFGPANDHLVHDFGAASVAIGGCLLVAVARAAWRTPVLLVATVWNGLHAVSHLVDLGDAGSRAVALAEVALLISGTALLAVLTVGSKEDT